MKKIAVLAIIFAVGALTNLLAAESEDGFVSIFDGKTFNGWKMANENTNTWRKKMAPWLHGVIGVICTMLAILSHSRILS
jgi:hypothetical protein